jgi:phosphohistidine phosphatase
MRTLLVLRHAKSSWKSAGLQDHERPLNKRGKQAARRMGEFMKAKALLPDLVLASSAVRVRETLDLWKAAAGYEGAIEVKTELYLAEPETTLACLNELGSEARVVMCVGHNPGLEQLVSTLTGKAEQLPTAALAEIRVPVDTWSQLGLTTTCELVNVWRVKRLRASED